MSKVLRNHFQTGLHRAGKKSDEEERRASIQMQCMQKKGVLRRPHLSHMPKTGQKVWKQVPSQRSGRIRSRRQELRGGRHPEAPAQRGYVYARQEPRADEKGQGQECETARQDGQKRNRNQNKGEARQKKNREDPHPAMEPHNTTVTAT